MTATRKVGARLTGMLYRLGFVVTATLVSAAPVRAQADHKRDEQAIRAQETRWRAVISKGDTAAIRSFYTADGIYAPSDRPIARGRDAVAHMWATGEFTLPKVALERTPIRIEVAKSGDLATEIGTWVFRTERKGKPTEYRGNYMFAWRKEGGQWKASAYMWNSEAPTR